MTGCACRPFLSHAQSPRCRQLYFAAFICLSYSPISLAAYLVYTSFTLIRNSEAEAYETFSSGRDDRHRTRRRAGSGHRRGGDRLPADGLHDGDHSWYQTQFDAFTQATGIKVQYVEGGSGAIVERLSKERSNPQADVATLPPFIQRAAAEKLLQDFTPQDAAQIADAQPQFVPLVNNYLSFIYNASCAAGARQLSTAAGRAVPQQAAVLHAGPRVTAPR